MNVLTRAAITVAVTLTTAPAIAAKDRGAGDPGKIDAEAIRLLLNTDALKVAIANYLRTIRLQEIVDASVRATLERISANDALLADIRSSFYEAGSGCKDENDTNVPASTLIGVPGAPICFDADKLAGQYKNLNMDDGMIRLASLAIHEHVHHFQNPLAGPANEAEANAVGGYFVLSARVAQIPVLEWRPPTAPASPYPEFNGAVEEEFEVHLNQQTLKYAGSLENSYLLFVPNVKFTSSRYQHDSFYPAENSKFDVCQQFVSNHIPANDSKRDTVLKMRFKVGMGLDGVADSLGNGNHRNVINASEVVSVEMAPGCTFSSVKKEKFLEGESPLLPVDPSYPMYFRTVDFSTTMNVAGDHLKCQVEDKPFCQTCNPGWGPVRRTRTITLKVDGQLPNSRISNGELSSRHTDTIPADSIPPDDPICASIERLKKLAPNPQAVGAEVSLTASPQGLTIGAVQVRESLKITLEAASEKVSFSGAWSENIGPTEPRVQFR